MGTSCPDHFLRTRISPMFVPWNPAAEGSRRAQGQDPRASTEYREDYASYYKAFAEPASPAQRGSDPSVVLISGLGLFGFAKDKREARITTEFFVNAIHVMAGANALEDAEQQREDVLAGAAPEQNAQFKSFHNYVALPRSEAFRIEYWALEEAKLQRMPPEKEFSRKIALVVGGASGIGREVALQLARKGAHVVVADLNLAARRRGRQGSGRGVLVGEMTMAGELNLASRESMKRGDQGDGAALRRPGRGDQHGGDLSDAGSVDPSRNGLGPGAQHQRHEQPRARAGSGRSAEGAGTAGERSS